MRPNFKNIDIANEAFNVEHKPLVMGEPWKNAELLDIKPIYTKQDLEGLQVMRNLAHNMSFLVKAIALGKEKYGMPEIEWGERTNFIR